MPADKSQIGNGLQVADCGLNLNSIEAHRYQERMNLVRNFNAIRADADVAGQELETATREASETQKIADVAETRLRAAMSRNNTAQELLTRAKDAMRHTGQNVD